MIPVIETDQAYKDAISAPTRSISVFMQVGYGIDSSAATDMVTMEGAFLPMSSMDQTTDAIYSLSHRFATFEDDGIPTASAMDMRVPPMEPATSPQEVGVWSEDLSDADGNMDWVVTMTFGSVHTSALTVFTPEVHILEAEVTFSANGAETGHYIYTSTGSDFQITEVYDYDRIVFRVLKVDQPYHHLRIIEVEFGASVTLSRDTITGDVRYLSEVDPTGQSYPLNELDFSVINRQWAYDYDSPSKEAEAVAIGRPLELSFRIATDTGARTVRCGRFYIRNLQTGTSTIRVTADDPRVIMTDVSKAWSIPTTQSIADAVDAVCEELFIAHVCDQSLYELYPVRDVTFDEDSTYMEDLTDLFQLYGIEMVPDSLGILQIRPYRAPQSFGTIVESRMFTYPSKSTNLTSYNYLTVRYGDSGRESYDVDLRTTASVAANQLYVNNPLIVTREEAVSVANRILSRLHNAELEVEWTGDPSMEVGDTVGFPGRWSDATERMVLYNEITYNGGLKERTRCVY